jgi:hypothetical protein
MRTARLILFTARMEAMSNFLRKRPRPEAGGRGAGLAGICPLSDGKDPDGNPIQLSKSMSGRPTLVPKSGPGAPGSRPSRSIAQIFVQLLLGFDGRIVVLFAVLRQGA